MVSEAGAPGGVGGQLKTVTPPGAWSGDETDTGTKTGTTSGGANTTTGNGIQLVGYVQSAGGGGGTYFYIPPEAIAGAAVVTGTAVVASGVIIGNGINEQRWEQRIVLEISKKQQKINATLGLAGSTPASPKPPKKNDNRSKNNQYQNKQANDAANRLNLSNEGRLELHNRLGLEYTGNFQKILEIASEIASLGGKYVR